MIKRIGILVVVVSLGILFNYLGRLDWTWAYIIVVYSIGALCATVSMMRRNHPVFAITWFLFSVLVMMYSFGKLHAHIGVLDSSGEVVRNLSRSDALYFSVATWTTLGYSDLRPSEAGRMVAAIEAFVGYIYMGFGIALAYTIFHDTVTSPGE